MSEYDLVINGKHTLAEADPRTPLLYVLRDIGIISPRYGCGLEQCGSCRVLVNGELEYACTKTIAEIAGARVETVEGLESANGDLHPVQQAFVEELSPQCGYCTPGQVMSAVGLLRANPNPTREEARQGLAGNICRCGSYDSYLNGVMRAAQIG